MALDATIATPPVSLLCQFKTFKRFKPLFPPDRDCVAIREPAQCHAERQSV